MSRIATAFTTEGRTCRDCGCDLIPGQNWLRGAINKRNVRCRSCVSKQRAAAKQRKAQLEADLAEMEADMAEYRKAHPITDEQRAEQEKRIREEMFKPFFNELLLYRTR